MTTSSAAAPRHPRLRALATSTACLVLGAGVFVVFLGAELDGSGDTGSVAFLLLVLADIVLGLAACALVGPIRRSVVGNLVVVLLAVVSTWALPALVVSVVRLGARRTLRLDALVVAMIALGSLGFALLYDLALRRPSEDPVLIVGITVVATVALLLWGRSRGTRAALVEALREQAASAEEARRATERTREAEVARARAEERGAIAREMHDGISHQLAIVAMHAGALTYRTDLAPEEQRAAAETVRDAAATGSTMLRDALVALRTTDGEVARSPLPDSLSIERLVTDARAAGHDVSVQWEDITATELQAMPGRAPAVARILAEVVLNARKYAPAAPLALRIGRLGDGVIIRASNPMSGAAPKAATAATGTGLGLVGVAERAAILGGSATSGPTASGTFDVEVRLP